MTTFKNDQEQLLEKYVATFEKLDDMLADELLSPLAWQLAVGKMDEAGFKRWRPVRAATEPIALEVLYAKLPARFPRLFEQLLLSYRWAEVDLGTYRLLANPLGDDLNGFLQEMSEAPDLWKALIPGGFIPFGKGPDMDYDPVCFDIKSRKQGDDCRIVKIDHEEILCNFRVKVVSELAPSFYELVQQTVAAAK
jgi:hypothetical protein